MTPLPFSATVQTRIRPQLEMLYGQLAREGRTMSMDGQVVFNNRDVFLPGKIAVGLAHLAEQAKARGDASAATRFAHQFGDTARLTLEDPNREWGLYYYILGLYKLKQAGLLEIAVDPQLMAVLEQRLDWRTFVDPETMALSGTLPVNYYGVAFSIARLRHLLGWEDTSGSERLLERMIDNYRTNSGEYGFSDELSGAGRFDRYSVLLIAEIAQRFIETGEMPPDEVKAWLRKSVDVILPRLGPTGEGFEYGRSLGPYGDTSFVEILTAAAWSGILTPAEMEAAYAHVSAAATRYVSFWIDPRTGSVNLWDGGRRTDAYRGKHRILGENLSLAHQYFYTSALWDQMGYAGRVPSPWPNPVVEATPERTTTWFARGAYDRFLITAKLGRHIVGLPFVNGGRGQHANSPYYPVPHINGVISGVADQSFPHMVPWLTLGDGSVVAPLVYFERAEIRHRESETMVSVHQRALNRLGEEEPVADNRVAVTTRYNIERQSITRTDEFVPAADAEIANVEVQFATFSTSPTLANNRITFDDGELAAIEVRGAGRCTVMPMLPGDDTYRSSTGAMANVIRCQGSPELSHGKLRVSWRLTLRN